MRTHVILVAAILASPGEAIAQFPPPSQGATVQVRLANGQKVDGELLAVGADTVWIRRGTEAFAAPFKDINTLLVHRGNKSGIKGGMIKMVVFGAVSGLIMTAACNSIDDRTGCEGVFLVSMGSSLVVGALSAASWESRKYETYLRHSVGWSGIWARFPQGWPSGVTAADVVRMPPKVER